LKLNKLLVGTIALVLIAGIGTQAFAQEFFQPQVAVPEFHLPPIDEVNEIFDNGRGDEQIGGPDIAVPLTLWADDFILDETEFLTDIHFDGILIFDPVDGPPLKEFEWFIYFDDVDTPGIPGLLFASGQGVMESQMLIESLGPAFGIFRFWFDLDAPVELNGGQTYWLSIMANEDPNSATLWLAKDHEFGSFLAVTDAIVIDWFSFGDFDLNFILTGDRVVGGELLPIDSTALVLAGLQSSAIWMLPVLAGAAGVGAFYIKTRMNKK